MSITCSQPPELRNPPVQNHRHKLVIPTAHMPRANIYTIWGKHMHCKQAYHLNNFRLTGEDGELIEKPNRVGLPYSREKKKKQKNGTCQVSAWSPTWHLGTASLPSLACSHGARGHG